MLLIIQVIFNTTLVGDKQRERFTTFSNKNDLYMVSINAHYD